MLPDNLSTIFTSFNDQVLFEISAFLAVIIFMFSVTALVWVIVISSIAYPDKFFNYINSKYNVIEKIQYKDHYNYTSDDLRGIANKLSDNISLITTEKDAVKLCEFHDMLSPYSVYYVPISTEYLFDDKLSDYIERLWKYIFRYF